MFTLSLRKMDDYVGKMLWGWISNKNKAVAKQQAKIKERGKESIAPDKPDNVVTPIIKAFVDAYQEVAIELKIVGWSKTTVNKAVATISEENMFTAAGWYQPGAKEIYINTINWKPAERKGLVDALKKIRKIEEYQSLDLRRWTSIAGYKFPTSTLPHELEHARRGEAHEGGGHNIIYTSLWSGDVARERTF